MWFTFALAALAAIAILYLPGFILWRALKFDNLMALCTAPIASIALLGVTAIAFEKFDLPATATTAGVCVLSVCVFVFAITSIGKRRRASLSFPTTFGSTVRKRSKSAESTNKYDWLLLGAYVLFGLIVACFVFVANIGDPEAFFSRWDNQTHISLVRAFLDSETWSSLVTGQYLAAPQSAQPYVEGPGFYPAGWHDIVAFACSATGASVPCGMNAVNVAFAGIVMPVSVFAFVKAAFIEDKFTLAAGAVTASACAIFPWWFFVTGPLYPNFAGLALVPACAGCAICILRARLFLRKLPSVIVLGLCSVASLALLQPNALFYLVIVLASYGASHVFHLAKERKNASVAVGVVLAYLVVIAVFWLACLHVPFLQSVVQYEQYPDPDIPAAFITLFGMIGIGPLFAFAALFGFIICCKRRTFWILIPAIFMAAACVFSRLDPTGIGRLLGGFWYTDFRRLGACFGFSLVPLAACGLGMLLALVSKPKKNQVSRSGAISVIGAGIIALAFFALNTFPSVEVEVGSETYGTGFGTFTSEIYKRYNPAIEHAYSADEVAFVDKALDTIGENELVINQPNDGSTFAYGVNGLDTYYRHCRARGQTEDSVTIRTKLADYASDETVQKAVNRVGAKYVLLLDQGVPLEDGVWLPQYSSPGPWIGIDGIRDDTPGFKVVLSEGDMRLYEIEKAA